MAIDDNTSYELTGAQVKDLAQRIKSSGSGMIVYVDASFESPSSITNVFSDSGLTTVADWEDMADVILAGGTVIAVYDNGSNKHQYVELVSVTVNDNIPFGKRFAGVISSNVGEGSKPLTIFLYYDDGIATPRWFAEGSSLPKRFSDLSGTVSTSQIADKAVTDAKIDWGTTSRPIYYKGTDWATSWTYKYYQMRPQLIFVAWQSSTALFCRIYDQIYKVYQNGGSTVTATIDTTNHQWTITTSNTGVLTVLEMNYAQAS